MDVSKYIKNSYSDLPFFTAKLAPWEIVHSLEKTIAGLLPELESKNYKLVDQVAIHESAVVEPWVTLKPNTIIGPGCRIKSGSYLRNGVYLVRGVSIGANCEIKQSILFDNSTVAHLNYVGNSILGKDVNLEAGAVLANHFNEREDKTIRVVLDGTIVVTNVVKFGSLLGDHARIGANSVLNPGTIVASKARIPRLTHVDQVAQHTAKNHLKDTQ